MIDPEARARLGELAGRARPQARRGHPGRVVPHSYAGAVVDVLDWLATGHATDALTYLLRLEEGDRP